MKKLLIVLFASLMLTGVSYAGSFGIGVSGSLAKVAAEGTETTTAGTVAGGSADKHSISVSEQSGIASVFVDYQFDNGFVIGISHVPGSADVSDKTHSRSETAQGVSGTDASGAVVRTAKAEVENFDTIYVEMPLGNFFAKLGYAQLDVNTQENAITGSGTYGNATLDGVTVGAGVNGNFGDFFTKTSVEYTDFEDLGLTSTTSNKITADLDVVEFKISLGKRF